MPDHDDSAAIELDRVLRELRAEKANQKCIEADLADGCQLCGLFEDDGLDPYCAGAPELPQPLEDFVTVGGELKHPKWCPLRDGGSVLVTAKGNQ